MNYYSWASSFVEVSVTVCVFYTLSLFAVGVVVLAFSAVECIHRSHQFETEDYKSVLKSQYTLPVSIVASAYNEEVMILASVRSLLNQNYPEFEVIVVDDGSTDNTLSLLIKEYDLRPQFPYYRHLIETNSVGSVFFGSVIAPRLVVVHKVNGGNKADAMNCGVNFSRYPYFCSVDGDTVYMPDAVLKTMTPINRDPDKVIGATSLFGISRTPEGDNFSNDGRRTVDRQLLSVFQHLDLMRSFIAYRPGWARLGNMLCNPGGFAIWKRDIFLEVGGFSNEFSCEDLEITFRIHEKMLREGRPYRILALPGFVAHTEGPDTAHNLVRQRARWPKVVLEVVWHYRYMLFRPKYKTVGMIGVPYYILFEALAPIMQIFSLLSLIFAIGIGVQNWPIYMCMVGIVMFASATVTTAAIFIHDSAYRDYRLRDIVRMLAIGPLDLFLYRPIIMYSGLRGTWQFLCGDRGWDKFTRNRRQPAG